MVKMNPYQDSCTLLFHACNTMMYDYSDTVIVNYCYIFLSFFFFFFTGQFVFICFCGCPLFNILSDSFLYSRATVICMTPHTMIYLHLHLSHLADAPIHSDLPCSVVSFCKITLPGNVTEIQQELFRNDSQMEGISHVHIQYALK